MKFIDKFFSTEEASWKEWTLRDVTSFDIAVNGTNSYLWKIINDELTTYRSLTYVNVCDGASTSFWFDHWLPDGPLSLSNAALFSHTTRPNISVQDVFQTNFDLCLRPRLTNTAGAQLAFSSSLFAGSHTDRRTRSAAHEAHWQKSIHQETPTQHSKAFF
jgi:hypothetical protein